MLDVPSPLFEPIEQRPSKDRLHVLLAAPRGFCAGVERAIAAVRSALDRHGAPVYVRRAIVHNMAVVRTLEAEGAIFVEEVDEVPPEGVLVLSAHGVSAAVRSNAQRHGRRLYDATCPLVEKVHREVTRHHRSGRRVILVGHRGHPEIDGTVGQLPAGATLLVAKAEDAATLELERDTPAAYAVQTTYSVEEAHGIISALRAQFSNLSEPRSSDICYATTNRQTAVKALARGVDAMIIVGEQFSSNACRLAEVARASGCRNVQLVAQASEVDWSMIAGAATLGISAAASTPEESVADLIEVLGERFRIHVEEVGSVEERVSFRPVEMT